MSALQVPTPNEARLAFCRSAGRALDVIERSDPAGHELVVATLRAVLATPPRAPLVPLRSRRGFDGRALFVVQAARYAIVLAPAPAPGTVDVVAVLDLQPFALPRR